MTANRNLEAHDIIDLSWLPLNQDLQDSDLRSSLSFWSVKLKSTLAEAAYVQSCQLKLGFVSCILNISRRDLLLLSLNKAN